MDYVTSIDRDYYDYYFGRKEDSWWNTYDKCNADEDDMDAYHREFEEA